MTARALAWADAASDAAGRVAAVLVVVLVALVFALVLARYGAGIGSVAAQEAVLWLHSALFLLGLCFALRHDAHVRVDVFSQRWSPRRRAWVEFGASLCLLLPFCVFIVAVSWDYVAASWSLREGSRDPGGLPGWYLLKALIPVSALLLALQGLAGTVRAWARATAPTADA
ncbi:TRAP transporter small permease subunit [Arenimonas caeni]|uniref:TRAP transporter small permease subunit n=1 Tax=Arenimonas caeni TaxID=2058085 RepID=UPI0019669094|nr:TRAP transporter small permease subunit [Arenimonas caeni]